MTRNILCWLFQRLSDSEGRPGAVPSAGCLARGTSSSSTREPHAAASTAPTARPASGAALTRQAACGRQPCRNSAANSHTIMHFKGKCSTSFQKRKSSTMHRDHRRHQSIVHLSGLTAGVSGFTPDLFTVCRHAGFSLCMDKLAHMPAG